MSVRVVGIFPLFLLFGVLHRLAAFCASQGRSWFEARAQVRAGGGIVVLGSDDVALQSGQCAEQVTLLSLPNVEFVEGFDQVFDQGVELASSHTHVLVRRFHPQSVVLEWAPPVSSSETF